MSRLMLAELDPIKIDPRPCAHCGLTINRHERIDTPEGSEFFCAGLSPDELTLEELERRADLIRQIEVADIFARLEAIDDPSKRLPSRERVPKPYRTPQATINSFWYVAGLDDPAYLARWLAQHPLDAPALQKLWEAKYAGS